MFFIKLWRTTIFTRSGRLVRGAGPGELHLANTALHRLLAKHFWLFAGLLPTIAITLSIPSVADSICGLALLIPATSGALCITHTPQSR